MAERTFTLDEAQTLLPILESLLKQAINGKNLIEDVDAELQEDSSSGSIPYAPAITLGVWLVLFTI